ncbi:DUF6894 family protein [Microvirga massiliensis]|uniref:DUF6894 family protein n=1 Tax=Microvirga massiliensis TaxID=1033741 RepID=UPI00062BD1AF|nr:hypothetical protein [Microvirga massiliensis]
MPRFFFDVHDGDGFTPDHEGIELKDIHAAEAEAVRALPDGDRRDFVVNVRDAAGRTLVRVRLTLAVEQISE